LANTVGLRRGWMQGPAHHRRARRRAGFTIVELAISLSIAAILGSLAATRYASYVERARVARATAEIQHLSRAIDALGLGGDEASYPDSLDPVSQNGAPLDPWGRPYQYLLLADSGGGGGGSGKQEKARKDRFLVPLNTDYDLYSTGADGESKAPLTTKVSQDDVVRANNGAFVGLASRF
jgi:general secretion pathway protein G